MEEQEQKVKDMIDELVEKAKIASKQYLDLSQEQVNNIIKAMAMAGLEHHMELAKMAVEETGRGIYEDKITKNMFATEYIYHSIKYEKTVGIINENDEDDYVEIAKVLDCKPKSVDTAMTRIRRKANKIKNEINKAFI